MSQGYEALTARLQALVTSYPPDFIFIHDPITPRITATVIRDCIQGLNSSPGLHIASACISAISCFTPRILYDTVLNALANWSPSWEGGCKNWSGPSGSSDQRYNDSFDAFVHGLQALRATMESDARPTLANGKGKTKVASSDETEFRMLLVIEQAERLKERLPDLVVPLGRLGELAQVEITTIFLSEVRWEQIRPPLGAAPDPYSIDVTPLSKEAILDRLRSAYPSGAISSLLDPHTYHPVLRPLYDHFLATLYSICSPFTTDPDDLAYIAAARWPGFVQPVLDEHKQRIEQFRSDSRGHSEFMGQTHEIVEDHEEDEEAAEYPELSPPTEDTRMRLIRLFTPTFTSALEALYPRLSSATEWANANRPPPNLLSIPPRHAPPLTSKTSSGAQERGVESLPRMAKFILIASFLASTNPAKTDLRMFGRGLDERTKRKKRRGGARKTNAKSTAVKIPQRLLGPLAFPLDRMVAILGCLLEENDTEIRPPAPEFTIPGEYSEMEISRVAVCAQVMELASMHLLHRATPSDKLDSNPTFKCGITYEVALSVAKDLKVPLNDLMWEPV